MKTVKCVSRHLPTTPEGVVVATCRMCVYSTPGGCYKRRRCPYWVFYEKRIRGCKYPARPMIRSEP